MPVEMGIWRIDGDAPRRLNASMLPSEATLEDHLARDPSLLGERLLVIGRQVHTPHGKYIDLLTVDEEGDLHVLELKRDRTPREVVAQLLDYGSWVATLTNEDVIGIANNHLGRPFEVAFDEVFHSPPPDELNERLTLTIVATDLDASSERIVGYLRTFDVPINAVFFSYLEDDERRYLARSWLTTRQESENAPTNASKKGKRAEWNGRDWYVSFGGGHRSWEDARRLGFVSAGGGDWYSRTLRNLPVGARVNVYLPQRGYVAIGVTLREAERFDQAVVEIDGQWVRLADQKVQGSYLREDSEDAHRDEFAEYVVPVRWLVAVPASEAFREPGIFASQHSACKLRQQYTLDRLAQHFALDNDDE